MSGLSLEHDWFPRPLPGNVRIGPRSWVYSSFAFLHCRSRAETAVSMGSDSGVYHTSFFELGEQGTVSIGNFCSVVGAVISTNGQVLIEDYAFIAHDVVIADDPFAGPPGHGFSQVETGRIRLGRNCWVGARATILGGADIGDDAIIGAGAVVDFVVPPGSIVVGCPGRVVRTLDPTATQQAMR